VLVRFDHLIVELWMCDASILLLLMVDVLVFELLMIVPDAFTAEVVELIMVLLDPFVSRTVAFLYVQLIAVLSMSVTFWSTDPDIVLFSSRVFITVLLVMLAPIAVERSMVEEFIVL